MAYKTITVDGVVYEYTIGSRFLKVKGFEALEHNPGYSKSDPEYTAVTPSKVADAIRTLKMAKAFKEHYAKK